MLFLRRRADLPRALAILWSTALDDLRMMERIRWTGAFAPADAALERYAGFVEALPLACPAVAHAAASTGGSEG
jgi:hypothetical protein